MIAQIYDDEKQTQHPLGNIMSEPIHYKALLAVSQ